MVNVLPQEVQKYIAHTLRAAKLGQPVAVADEIQGYQNPGGYSTIARRRTMFTLEPLKFSFFDANGAEQLGTGDLSNSDPGRLSSNYRWQPIPTNPLSLATFPLDGEFQFAMKALVTDDEFDISSLWNSKLINRRPRVKIGDMVNANDESIIGNLSVQMIFEGDNMPYDMKMALGIGVNREVLIGVRFQDAGDVNKVAGIVNGNPALTFANVNMVFSMFEMWTWEGAQFVEQRGTAGYPGEPINLRTLGADPTGVKNATPFFNLARETGRPIIIDGTFRMEECSYVDPGSLGGGGLRLIGQDGKIIGWDGHGFAVSGGDINLSGNLTFEDFRDPTRDGPGTDWQKTNQGAACIGVEPSWLPGAADAANVWNLVITKGVRFVNCRSGIRCSGINTPNKIHNVMIDGLYCRGVPTGILLTGGSVSTGRVVNSVFLDGISAGSDLGAIVIGPDDIPLPPRDPVNTPNAARDGYRALGGFTVANNYINRYIQKTVTGDSSTGNQYSCVGIVCNGWGVTIAGNVVRNVQGVNSDCEGIYSKSVGGVIVGNSLYNSGATEAAIAIKGVNPIHMDDANQYGNGPGAHALCIGNSILFDQYSYNHDDIEIPTLVNMERNGITLNAGDNTAAFSNVITGANGVGILGDEDDSSIPNKYDLSVLQNRILNHQGQVGVLFNHARFYRASIKGNEIEFAEDNDHDLIAGVKVGKLVKGFQDSVIKGNSTRLVNATKNTIASCVHMDIPSWSLTGAVELDDNKILGAGHYDTRTHHFSLAAGSTWDATGSRFKVLNMLNSYIPSGPGRAFMFGGYVGSIPSDALMTGEFELSGVTAGDRQRGAFLDLPMESGQSMNIEIKWRAYRENAASDDPRMAHGVYRVGLGRVSGAGSFVGKNPATNYQNSPNFVGGRTPANEELCYYGVRGETLPLHGISEETYPQLGRDDLRYTFNYPRFYTESEARVDSSGNQHHVAVIYFDPIEAGTWTVKGEYRS